MDKLIRLEDVENIILGIGDSDGISYESHLILKSIKKLPSVETIESILEEMPINTTVAKYPGVWYSKTVLVEPYREIIEQGETPLEALKNLKEKLTNS